MCVFVCVWAKTMCIIVAVVKLAEYSFTMSSCVGAAYIIMHIQNM